MTSDAGQPEDAAQTTAAQTAAAVATAPGEDAAQKQAPPDQPQAPPDQPQAVPAGSQAAQADTSPAASAATDESATDESAAGGSQTSVVTGGDPAMAQPGEASAPAMDAGVGVASAPQDRSQIAGLDSVQQTEDAAVQDNPSPVALAPPASAGAPPSAAFDTANTHAGQAPPIEAHAATVQESATGTPEVPAPEPPLKPRVQMNRASDEAALAVPTGNADGGSGGPDRGAVAIPRKDDPLGDDLEADITAALAGAALTGGGPVNAPGADLPDITAGGQVTDAGGSNELAVGQRCKGVVTTIHGGQVIIDIPNARYAGVIPDRQFGDTMPEVGAELEVVVDAVNETEGNASCSLPSGSRRPGGNWDAVEAGQVVDVMIKKVNKGGLEVTVGTLRGFMPASQVDLGFVEDLSKFVGQKMAAKIIEVNPQRKKLVVSRRALLAEERAGKEEELFGSLAKGQTRTGTVKSIKDFGAFVDLGGADGLLHIGQISWSRINHPSDVLAVGQEVEVQVLEVDAEKKKISLSMRQLQSNPWSTAEANYPVGSVVKGKVTRVADFGAFVMLEPGVEGLVHISQLSRDRVRAVGDVLSQGQEVDAKVMEVDTSRRRISLSLKALHETSGAGAGDGDGPPAEDDPKEERRRQRRRGQKLRGGTGGHGKGGLFGNPNDFD